MQEIYLLKPCVFDSLAARKKRSISRPLFVVESKLLACFLNRNRNSNGHTKPRGLLPVPIISTHQKTKTFQNLFCFILIFLRCNFHDRFKISVEASRRTKSAQYRYLCYGIFSLIEKSASAMYSMAIYNSREW